MVIEIRVYYEGDIALKPGFDRFFSEIRELAKEKAPVRFISTGADWRRDFRDAIESHPDAWNVLLIDSEGPFTSEAAARLCQKHGWSGRANSIFWMVEAMESWFHADKKSLGSYYGEGFKKGALAAARQVEKIPKKRLLDGLKNATRHTQKGKYHKTAHAPKLLAAINAKLVRQAAPNCDKLFQALETKLNDLWKLVN